MKRKDIKQSIKEYFFINPSSNLRVRGIERTLKLPLPSVIRYCKELEKEEILTIVKTGNVSFGFYESPKRIIKTLGVLEEHFGAEKRVFVGREMTKFYEDYYRGKIPEVKLQMEKSKMRGEIVVVVEGYGV